MAEPLCLSKHFLCCLEIANSYSYIVNSWSLSFPFIIYGHADWWLGFIFNANKIVLILCGTPWPYSWRLVWPSAKPYVCRKGHGWSPIQNHLLWCIENWSIEMNSTLILMKYSSVYTIYFSTDAMNFGDSHNYFHKVQLTFQRKNNQGKALFFHKNAMLKSVIQMQC